MNNIDFLPCEYRLEHSRRRRQVWQIVAIIFVCAAVSVAALVQSHRTLQLQSQIDGLEPRYKEAMQRNSRLADLEKELHNAQDQAELFTYLRHPWPRTQIISALVQPLPQGVTLRQLKIVNRRTQDAPRRDLRSREQQEDEEKRLASLSPAARDLEELRTRMDYLRVEVNVSGVTVRPDSVHAYVGNLTQDSLFERAELESFETDKHARNGQMLFHINVAVKPGYGQANGPSGPPDLKSIAAHSGGSKQTTDD